MPSLMLKAVCEIAVRIRPHEARKDTNLVVKQLEVHDSEGRVRVLPNITAEENWNASLDQLDNGFLQIADLGVHV